MVTQKDTTRSITFHDVNVRRIVIPGVEPKLKAVLTFDCRHGNLNPSG